MNKSKRHRRGYALVVFVLLMSALLGLAALVIDLGFARLAQRQMQSAVDTAALEGLRFRDELPPNAATDDFDEARRQQASDFVAWMFDDNLDPDSAQFDAPHFGAGPVVELTGGVGDPTLNAGQLITVPASPVYKPHRSDGEPGLELNLANSDDGDMVAIPDGLQVHMRRTSKLAEEQPGISSRGPAVPLLFGRGALLPNADSSTGYSPRREGITVRATATAHAEPARSIGSTYLSADPSVPDVPGMIPIAIRATEWMSMSGVRTLSIDATDRAVLEDSSNEVGFVMSTNADSAAVSVGSQPPYVPAASGFVSSMVAGAAEDAGTRRGYLVIVGDSTIPPVDVVVGFGFADGITQIAPDQFQLTKRINHIASQNASAIPLATLSTLVAADAIHSGFELQEHALLAPALVR